MDAERFERVLRIVTTSASRRQTIGGIVGAVLGWGLGRHPSIATAKGKHGKGKKRKRTRPLCTGQCAGRSCGDDGCGGSCGTCGPHTACQGGTCGCANGLVGVGGQCVQPCTSSGPTGGEFDCPPVDAP